MALLTERRAWDLGGYLTFGSHLGLAKRDSNVALGNHNNLDYDSEPDRTLLRRRREARRARQVALE
ncbi:hypothetical protein PIB30_075874 [Stylosanthes scabra]|uniref:Uncharacterized protein n=1 Tax=Stylosanthes scabra TaxID=79078 RepID=A0ABU6UNY5_9FABA|nr:hypothetical protein [Stylosanthes scabra]